ncbi:hypothetical protein FPOAC2_03881 [Fusarium poae]|uniref:hypothetical protein n=1 Tax=Fusarium poae TaxID=36050 RepID=UPI001CE8A332|nr:hypothetical protein FPOAC1_003772 [Fusarium poae]KAG8677744.1 hypothetical protein FPOAC1_003772 [Fusarium poae]
MSGSPPTQNQASGVVNTKHRYLRRKLAFVDQNIHDIFRSAALANGSTDVRETEKKLYDRLKYHGNRLPFAAEPNLINMDFSIQRKVGTVHYDQGIHADCGLCSMISLRLSYYPYTIHDSQHSAAFCIDYRIQKPGGQDERASSFHLQCCPWDFGRASPVTLQNLVSSLRLGEALDDFNANLALSMVIEIKWQIRANKQYTCRTNYKDAFKNVDYEVERFLSFWEELKDDICDHLFTKNNTYFDSRDVGLFI